MAITKIAEITVGSGGAASIDFTSIPGTYTDLLVVHSIRSTQAIVSAYATLTITPTSSTYSMRGLYGTGSGAGSFTTPVNYIGELTGANATSSTFGNGQIYFPNYAGSTFKSYSTDSVGESNGSAANQSLTAGLWSTTSAITGISIVSTSGTFVQYSSATLYGVLKGSSGGVVVS